MDPREIFRNDKLLEFWPTAKQSASERTAATARFVIYASVLIYIINRDPRVFALGVLVLAILFYLYNANLIKDGKLRPAQGDGRASGPFREQVYMPSYNNPMGNVLHGLRGLSRPPQRCLVPQCAAGGCDTVGHDSPVRA